FCCAEQHALSTAPTQTPPSLQSRSPPAPTTTPSTFSCAATSHQTHRPRTRRTTDRHVRLPESRRGTRCSNAALSSFRGELDELQRLRLLRVRLAIHLRLLRREPITGRGDRRRAVVAVPQCELERRQSAAVLRIHDCACFE